MVDAERMLSSLVRSALGSGRRRRRRPSLLGVRKSAIGLGALGVAIAAFEHFTQEGRANNESTAGQLPLPPLPVRPTVAGPSVDAGSVVPPPPPGSNEDRDEALLLVHAMIAAANADHRMDDQERQRLLDGIDESGAGAEDRDFLLAEFENPMDLATLTSHATSPDLARRVYLASLMAIDVDTPAEANYVARLAQRLGLDQEQVQELEGMLDPQR